MTALAQAVLLTSSQRGGEEIQLLKLEGGDSSFISWDTLPCRGEGAGTACGLLLFAVCSCSLQQFFPPGKMGLLGL